MLELLYIVLTSRPCLGPEGAYFIRRLWDICCKDFEHLDSAYSHGIRSQGGYDEESVVSWIIQNMLFSLKVVSMVSLTVRYMLLSSCHVCLLARNKCILFLHTEAQEAYEIQYGAARPTETWHVAKSIMAGPEYRRPI